MLLDLYYHHNRKQLWNAWNCSWGNSWGNSWGPPCTPPPTTDAQSGVSRLGRHLWKPPKLKISRELLEQIQAESLKPAKITPDPTTPNIIPRSAVTPYQEAGTPKKSLKTPVIYRPRDISQEDPWDHIFQRVNESYLQNWESKLKYKQIRDRAQEELDEEQDVELLLMMH